jgi:hypothetical protein
MSDCCIFYASTHNVVICVNKCVISMSDYCMFYASTHSVVTFHTTWSMQVIQIGSNIWHCTRDKGTMFLIGGGVLLLVVNKKHSTIYTQVFAMSLNAPWSMEDEVENSFEDAKLSNV